MKITTCRIHFFDTAVVFYNPAYAEIFWCDSASEKVHLRENVEEVDVDAASDDCM